jgi:hypothetical protein
MKLFSDEQELKIWWYLVGLMAGYKIEIMHGNFAPFFFFFFLFLVCSTGFELSICIFSLKSWYVGKGNEWQQRIFLVHIVWSQLIKVADLIYHNKISNIYLALHQLEASAVSDTFNYQHFEIRNCSWVSDIGVFRFSWVHINYLTTC